ncbi:MULTISPECIES: choice-of-anchor K domain-containing protein [Nostoc]|uniref:Choice-of-anchor K domain-containing protein n=1 Tax=Nostoc paludosum FACHB-159 TaxID=2692908 RepID=A0ABR8K817_9NOSO|nr:MULTISPECIES: choice-of-anchor K domain-containing protein [Nostoc]MBD2678155.1 choice-of-anchor K domain-containing protein [Nostoc sp. FACHB-857]MBD2734415.1 choice-of-anchor K domain-containing protein [Nostoc paludosum FACHB-159]
MKQSLVVTTAVSSFFVTATTAFGFSGQAQAFSFSGISSGTWGVPTPGSLDTNPTFTGVGTNTFTWGQPSAPSTLPNKLIFDGSSFSGNTDSLFKIGELKYFNETVLKGTSVEFVPLNLNLSLNSPVGINQAFGFDFRLVNTPNIATNTPEQNADFVFIDTNLSYKTFTFAGNKYTLELTGFNPDVPLFSIQALEGGTTTASVYAKIKTIPEPATIAGLSLLGIYFLSRKKSLQKN